MNLNQEIIIAFMMGYIFFNPNFVTSAMTKTGPDIADEDSGNSHIKFTILYDNYVFAEGTQADWGFSCLIENTEKTILFDTGNDPDILIKNMKQTGIDINRIDAVVISHIHGDHTGGLFEVLGQKSDIEVFLPHSTENSFREKVKDTGGKTFSSLESSLICENVYLSGELGGTIKEQALIVNTQNGLVILTGCSHPGIVHIVKTVQEKLPTNVYMILGGFHLMNHSRQLLDKIIPDLKKLGVEYCAASHCTGDEALRVFTGGYGANFIKIGTGKVLEISP